MSEIKTLREKLPHLEFETLLCWATSNAAALWGFEKLGTFKKGTKPGVVLLNETAFSVRRIL
jgi:cytosine/adenosine deaminase-related metal-dependent hydrolase